MKDLTRLRAAVTAAGILAAVPVVKTAEGIYKWVYIDPVGIPTACYGHTGPELRPGQVFTTDECDGLLYEDLLAAVQVVDSCVKVPLSGGEKSGYVSMAFNVGRGKKGVKDGFCELKSGRPSTLVVKLNSGDRAGACAQISLWAGATVAGVRVRLPGLVKRRAAERALCEQGLTT